MKKLLFLLLALVSLSVFSELKAQGSNLEFNRVFLLKKSNGVLTVSNNKLWKINSAGRNDYNNTACNNSAGEIFSVIFIDGFKTWIHYGDFPYFIPEGIEVFVQPNGCEQTFSITEYNIVP